MEFYLYSPSQDYYVNVQIFKSRKRSGDIVYVGVMLCADGAYYTPISSSFKRCCNDALHVIQRELKINDFIPKKERSPVRFD